MIWSRLIHRGGALEVQGASALRRVPLFRDVPLANLLEVWRRFDEVRVGVGEVICRRGEPGDRFYVIQSGEVEVRLGLDETGVLVRRLFPGDFIGEMALLTGAPRSADVLAVNDCVLWSLDRAEFEAVCRQSPSLLGAFNRYLCERLAYVTNVLEQRDSETSPGPAGRRFGPYRAVAQIGHGGMSAVYSAVHTATNQIVALKVLPLGWKLAQEFQARLRREATILQRVEHPNVVQVLEVGTVDDRLGGGIFIAMEWLPGGLDRVLRAQLPEPLPVRSALAIARGTAAGLAAVHARGIVHRDVKPSNIMLRGDGTPVVVDFGLAATIGELAQKLRLTPENVIVGTADYLAPEQIKSEPLDGRCDVYALGIVLYEMLTGSVPFAELEPLDTLRAHLEEPLPALPSELPVLVRTIVERALQKRSDDRFPSAAALVGAIDEALTALPKGYPSP